ncbi:MAG TPA: high light inducible protein [Leptolyngbyaceae cyanobacterium M65_K2018_010]|nr:high light inducible protein [Leptolyngbyaceae cyanobacterium M65_K2018_010]
MTHPPAPSAAQAAAPEQLESPPQTTDEPTPAFGWTPYAERINGRFAMVGFIALLLIEWFTRQDFFTWLGF